MTRSRPIQQRAVGAPGIKALITAVSLAATLGGWAALADTQIETIDPASSPPARALAPQRPSIDLTLAPLPTIVPPPNIAIDRSSPIDTAPSGLATPASPLRVVTVPPQPVARTRSSR
jgi:hypothetical protein